MNKSAGYSATPLYKKLGLRPGMKVLSIGMPPDVREMIEAGVNGVVWVARPIEFEAAHLFATRLLDLKKQLLRASKALPPRGFIWISWPKKSSAERFFRGATRSLTRARDVERSALLIIMRLVAPQ